jgi:hypothetical protein
MLGAGMGVGSRLRLWNLPHHHSAGVAGGGSISTQQLRQEEDGHELRLAHGNCEGPFYTLWHLSSQQPVRTQCLITTVYRQLPLVCKCCLTQIIFRPGRWMNITICLLSLYNWELPKPSTAVCCSKTAWLAHWVSQKADPPKQLFMFTNTKLSQSQKDEFVSSPPHHSELWLGHIFTTVIVNKRPFVFKLN